MPQFWAGFSKGKIDTEITDTGWGGLGVAFVRMPMLFTRRADARARYEDVRKVEVRIVSKHPKR